MFQVAVHLEKRWESNVVLYIWCFNRKCSNFRKCVLCSSTVMRETTKRLTVNIYHGIVLRYTGRKLP